MRFLFPWILLLQCLSAHAVNWLIPSAVNQVWEGKFCSQVKQQEYDGLVGEKCRDKGVSPQMLTFSKSVADMVHNVVFEEAAQKQLPRDECMAQALICMKNDEKKRSAWMGTAVASWLAYKKTIMIRDRCVALRNREVLSPGKSLPQELERWRSTCENPNTYQALQNAERLFTLVLPILSDAQVYDAVGSMRQAIIDKNTGQPITDEAILNLNMRSFKSIKVNGPAMKQVLEPILAEAIDHRTDAYERLKKVKESHGTEDMDIALRNYLYEQGTVKEVMTDRELIKVDSEGKVTDTTYGGSCIVAWYEPTVLGELLDMAVTSVIGAGPASRAIKLAQPALNAASKLPIVGGMIGKISKPVSALGSSKLMSGMFVGAGTDSSKQIYKNCLINLKNTSRLTNSAETDKALRVQGNFLPDDVDYDRYDAKLDDCHIPACTANEKGQNYLLNAEFKAHCVRESLMAVLPIQLAVGALAVPF